MAGRRAGNGTEGGQWAEGRGAETAEEEWEGEGRDLAIILGAMAGSVCVLVAVVGFLVYRHQRRREKAPEASVRSSAQVPGASPASAVPAETRTRAGESVGTGPSAAESVSAQTAPTVKTTTAAAAAVSSEATSAGTRTEDLRSQSPESWREASLSEAAAAPLRLFLTPARLGLSPPS